MLKACWLWFIIFKRYVEFSGSNSVLAGIPLTNAHGENRQFSLQNMFYLCPFNSVVIQYFLSNFAHMHFCDMHHKWLGPNCCKCKTVSEILRQNVTMHAAGLIRLACGPTSRLHRAAHVESQIVPLSPQSLTIRIVSSVLNDARRRYEKCIVLWQ